MNREIGFGYGALAPKLAEQAKEQGFMFKKDDESEMFERSRESITWLMFRDIITDSQVNKAFQKLHKQVIRALKPIESEEK